MSSATLALYVSAIVPNSIEKEKQMGRKCEREREIREQ